MNSVADLLSTQEKHDLLTSQQYIPVGLNAVRAMDTLARTLESNWLYGPAVCLYNDADRQVLVFRLPNVVRTSDIDYLLLYRGHVVVLRRLGTISNKFSFQGFPASLEKDRPKLQSVFTTAFTTCGEANVWHNGPWDALPDDVKAEYSPAYQKDNEFSPDF
jgi:hypothetical protein